MEAARLSSDAEVRQRAAKALTEIRKSAFEKASEAISRNTVWTFPLVRCLAGAPVVAGGVVLFVGLVARKSRTVRTWTCGEIMDNDEMRVSGTHFYKTISEMGGLKQLYEQQEKKWFDLYDLGGKLGLGFSSFLRWLHSGLLPMYLTWVILGLLIILTVFCKIW